MIRLRTHPGQILLNSEPRNTGKTKRYTKTSHHTHLFELLGVLLAVELLGILTLELTHVLVHTHPVPVQKYNKKLLYRHSTSQNYAHFTMRKLKMTLHFMLVTGTYVTWLLVPVQCKINFPLVFFIEQNSNATKKNVFRYFLYENLLAENKKLL